MIWTASWRGCPRGCSNWEIWDHRFVVQGASTRGGETKTEMERERGGETGLVQAALDMCYLENDATGEIVVEAQIVGWICRRWIASTPPGTTTATKPVCSLTTQPPPWPPSRTSPVPSQCVRSMATTPITTALSA